jgi:outer membrane lipoprotein-sorting protein
VTVHEHVQQALSAMLDGQVDPEQGFLAERHLQQCGTCAAAMAAFAGVDALTREVLLPSGPAPFEAALARRLAAEPVESQPFHSRRPPRPRRRLWLAGVAAVLVVLAVATAAVVVPSTRHWPLPVPTTVPGPQPELLTLAKVVVRAEQAVTRINTLQGRFTSTEHAVSTQSGSGGTVTTSYRFVFASPDRLRVQGGPGADVRLLITDGPAARRVMVGRDDPRPRVSGGVPLVRPQDQDALAPLTQGLTLWFRNRLENPDRPAKLTTKDGRRVYVLLLGYEWSSVAGPRQKTHLEVWVDPTTFLPVRIQTQDRSKPDRVVVRSDVRYTYDRVNSRVPPGAFAVPPGALANPPGSSFPGSGQFRSMSLERATAQASYRVPHLGKLPRPGWRLLRSGFAPVGAPTGSEGANPQGRDLVVAVYGSGLERMVMTTVLVTDQELRRHEFGQRYADPFGGEGIQRVTKRYRLRAGAYTGTVVNLGLPSDDAPYLWFRSGGVVVTLSGAASSQDLIAMAESLTR